MAHEIGDVDREEEEQYDENADEDFNPEEANEGEDDASSSSSGDEIAVASRKKPQWKGRKRKITEVKDDLDSGDEATIQERKKKRRKGGSGDTDEDDGDEDSDSGAGGLIKTRAQRLAEKVEKKQRRRTTTGDVTIDVDQLWADLNSASVGRAPDLPPPSSSDAMDVDGKPDETEKPATSQDEMITIKRRIEYAGEITEVEEQVARDSEEAQQYLAEHPEEVDGNKAEVRRPLKRPSMFEPNPTAAVKGVPADRLRPRAPNRLDVQMAARRAAELQEKKAQRMTTVQKSALDWRGFVDTNTGLRAELDEYGKSKHGYLAREAFLDRAQGARDAAAREARLKG